MKLIITYSAPTFYNLGRTLLLISHFYIFLILWDQGNAFSIRELRSSSATHFPCRMITGYGIRKKEALSHTKLLDDKVGRSGALYGMQQSEVQSMDLENETTLLLKVQSVLKPGSKIVIKYGGHAMENEELQETFFADIALLYRELHIVPIIVHGGGPQIAKMLKALNVPTNFVNGLRVTDDITMEVAQMVLCGLINKNIARKLSLQPGVKGALGLSGLDSQLITGYQKDLTLGFVGEPATINSQLLELLMEKGYIPVVSPVGSNNIGSGSLNINADTSACAIAQAVRADTFVLLTDITGVLDKQKSLIKELPADMLDELVMDGTISGGMIPKLANAVAAVKGGVGSVCIADGRLKHCVLKALSGERFGTIVRK